MSLEDLSLEQRDELASLAKTLADNPQTRKEFLRQLASGFGIVPILTEEAEHGSVVGGA